MKWIKTMKEKKTISYDREPQKRVDGKSVKKKKELTKKLLLWYHNTASSTILYAR